MKLSRVTISQFMGISELTFDLASGMSVVSGTNAAGKSSVLAALRACVDGHDASVIRKGSESAEIMIELDDGARVRTRVTPDKTNVTVNHPILGSISRKKEFLTKLIGSLSLNPVSFLTAKPAAQCALLLDALPLKLTPATVRELVSGTDETERAYALPCQETHALKLLDELEKPRFEQRTGITRALKEKRNTVAQLFATLPAGTDPRAGIDWQAKRTMLEDEERSMIAADTAAIAVVRREADQRKASITEACQAALASAEKAKADQLAATRQREADEIAAIKARAAEAVALLERSTGTVTAEREREARAECDAIDNKAQIALDAMGAEQEQRHAALSEQLGEAKANADQQTRNSTTCMTITQVEAEAQVLEDEQTALTATIERIRRHRESLTAQLPIKGVAIRDGEIAVNGVALHLVNTAERIRIAVELAMLKTGELKLVCFDDLEHLDLEHRTELAKQIEAHGMQAIAAMVSDEPGLHIETVS